MPDAYLREHPNPNLRQYSTRKQEPSGVVAVHTAESTPDAVATDGGAEAVAGYISRRDTPGSYHDLVDSDSGINVVRYEDAAWHDGTGTNHHSYGVSVATTAAWWPFAPKKWRDGAIEQAAQAASRYAHWLYKRNGIRIPAKRITADEARRKVPGFVSHGQLDPGRRTDPGEFFPWQMFLARFAELTRDLWGGTVPTNPNEEFTMDAEAKAAFAKLSGEVDALGKELDAVRAAQLISVDEGRKQYGSLRGWLAAIADTIAKIPGIGRTYNEIRTKAGELDTYVNPGAGQ